MQKKGQRPGVGDCKADKTRFDPCDFKKKKCIKKPECAWTQKTCISIVDNTDTCTQAQLEAAKEEAKEGLHTQELQRRRLRGVKPMLDEV